MTELKCGFEYTIRWPEIIQDLISGDDTRVANAVQVLDNRDREIELWSGTVCDCCGGTPTLSVAVDEPYGEDSGWTGVADLGTMTLPGGSVTINIVGTAENAPLTQPLKAAYELDGPDTIGDITSFSFTGDDTTVTIADPQTITGGSYDVKIAFRVGGGTGVNIGTIVDYTFEVS